MLPLLLDTDILSEVLKGDPRLYFVNFDPARGHKIKKTRPALVIQNDTGNQYSSRDPITMQRVYEAISIRLGLIKL